MKEKFHIVIESYHIADSGFQSNVSKKESANKSNGIFFLFLHFMCLLLPRWNIKKNKNNFYTNKKTNNFEKQTKKIIFGFDGMVMVVSELNMF